MDIGATIIGAILAAICLLPFVLTARSRKKREDKTLKSLMDIAMVVKLANMNFVTTLQ